jgi:hypothetical protein
MLDKVFGVANYVNTAVTPGWTTLSSGKVARHRVGGGECRAKNICAPSWTRTAHEDMDHASSRDIGTRHPCGVAIDNT